MSESSMIIKKTDAIQHQNSENYSILEYPYEAQDSSFATAELNGRYPEIGFSVNAVNEECVEMFYILSGTLTVHEDENIRIANVGDFVRIEKDTPYFLEGENVKFCIIHTPRFILDQHKNISF